MQAQQSDTLSGAMDETVSPDKEMKRIGAAGFTGTFIEFYDLQIYTTAAALVFAHVFFPQLGKVAGTIAAFGTIGVVFVARPLGSVLFGHLGDRLGRKRVLVITLLMMGISTILTGLLPTSEEIGVLAPTLLIVLRIIQGLAAGGEYGGAALLIAESAPIEKRGAWSALPQLGGAASTSFAALTFLITSLTMSDHAFRSWGWRLPFLFSGALLVVGLYIRFKIRETTVFTKEIHRRGASKAPIVDAFNAQPRDLFLACMVAVPSFAMLYLVLTYVVSYGVNQLNLGYTEVLLLSAGNGVVLAVGQVISSRLSDRIGRRPVLIFANGLATVWALALFPVLHIGTVATYAIATIVSLLIGGFISGPLAAFMCELFQTRYRYTAVGLCYSAAGILGGGLPPLIAGSIISAYGTFAVGRVLGAICFVSFCCCIALRETRGRALDADFAEQI